jgi:hypothetical protein
MEINYRINLDASNYGFLLPILKPYGKKKFKIIFFIKIQLMFLS